MTGPGGPPISGRQPRAVRTALAVLEEVVAAGPGVTAKEISAALRLPPATTYRVLNLLVGDEYLVRLPDLRGFALGRRAARLSPVAVPRPSTAARAVVEHLRGMVRWGVHLAVFDGGRLHLADPDPDHPPSDPDLLARLPQASALGRLLLAEQADWRALVRDLRPVTGATLTDPDELAELLPAVARDGLAAQTGGLRPDRGCLAAAVRSPADRRLVAGLALSGPAGRITDPDPDLVALLRDHADRLGPLLG
ncbi:transcriptional regulator, IclR family [Pseudonocardia ammonioxydans]|uniref:Transcriptional regulator, IclR family n=1 Tax=Pseudonocardia ammonioxydans TaxID=260086 RepID=A0A1I5E093_PSUAM|nr:IclR family transcriptional regulator C-terminal domain-containing protein [Pseudonocardia ammonioxydans]SFO04803.1 transcriptional regulator, IclR family [Pseudonocardia ammonioxydans]